MMSLRLDPELDAHVRRAAQAEGASISEFLRRAAAERADRTLSSLSTSEQLADVIGMVKGGGRGFADDSGKAFTDLLVEKHRAETEKYRKR